MPVEKEQRAWFKPGDVTRFTVDYDREMLGRGGHGIVKVGKIKFKGRKPFQVAVKLFHDLYHPLPTAEQQQQYEKVIRDLRAAGVRMPKMGFLMHGGARVLVSELFKRGDRTKLVYDRYAKSYLGRLTDDEKEKLLEHIARVIRAGYPLPSDSTSFVPTKKGMQPILHDLDGLVGSKHDHELAAAYAREWIKRMYPSFDQREARLRAIRFLIDSAPRAARKALKRERPKI